MMTVVGVEQTDSSAVHVSGEERHAKPLRKGEFLYFQDEPIALLLVMFGAPMVVAEGPGGRGGRKRGEEEGGGGGGRFDGCTSRSRWEHSQVIQQLCIFVESTSPSHQAGESVMSHEGSLETSTTHLFEKPPNPVGENLPMMLRGFNLLSRMRSAIDIRG